MEEEKVLTSEPLLLGKEGKKRMQLIKKIQGTIRPACDVRFKFICVGSATVGKTSLIMRFSNEKYSESLGPTIGVDFENKYVAVGHTIVQL